MNIIAIISPLIMVALLGFICTKSQWISKKQLDALSQFTFYISIPAFLFYQMAKADFTEQVSPQLFASFYLPVLACYLIAWLINYFCYQNTLPNQERLSANKNKASSAVFALATSYSNTVIVGLPILLAALGEQVLGIIFLIVTFHSAMLFTLTSILAAKTSKTKTSKIEKSIVFTKQITHNPLIASILAGLLVNLSGIHLPAFIQDSLSLISQPAITLALFILGASLAFYQVRNALTFISIACLGKLILLPSLVLFTSQYIFNLPPLIVTVLVVLSACPTGVNAYLVAASHQQHQQTTAGAIVLSTLVSIITIPLWLALTIN